MSERPSILRRAKRADRLMAAVIRVGGLSIIAAVIGILLFIGKEALPLFLPAAVKPGPALVLPPAAGLLADESGRVLIALRPEQGALPMVLPGAQALAAPPGPPAPWAALLAPDPKGATLVRAADGRLYVGQLGWEKPSGENDPSRWTALAEWKPGLDTGGRPLRPLAFRSVAGSGLGGGETLKVAALDGEALVCGEGPLDGSAPFRWTALERSGVRAALWSADGAQLVVGTVAGRVLVLEPSTGSTPVREADFGEPVSALGFALGQGSILVGGERGAVAAFQQVRVDEQMALQKLRDFGRLEGGVRGFHASLRDKRFLTWTERALAVDHLTTGRRFLATPASDLAAATLGPKGDVVYAASRQGQLATWLLEVPHPEVSWATLWRATQYEGYDKPQHAWQSTGGTDDFEPKLGLLPLVFGTLKGTLYALLFALPVTILGALYSSQFAHPTMRNLIKPTVEVMAALPSVVLGFLAGLVLAPMFERSMVQFLVIPALALALMLLALPLWRALPQRVRRVFGEGREALWMVPVILGAFALAVALAPSVERLAFGGDYRLWLTGKGIAYDQRNSIVVGFAMGFAVIPIIFTISEDALSSVPKSLTSASLACGASPWQTAWRVVLPTASPGIFSAVMVGLGRAIGETMIVLMATGNTPVMEWNPFNGMRTLAANIAVEVPEAPQHGSLYRVLFLTAFLLFLMTFLLNTVAEFIRQRLRKRYESL